jgi:crossover junction endodeoxyribonuclease RuvC
MTTIIGIDPGLASTGLGVVRGCGLEVEGYSFGCITTASSMPLAARLDRIFTKLSQLFEAERPELVVVEDVFSLQEYPKSGIALGQVLGVVMLAACRTGIGCVEIPVREAKRILTGNGNASKHQLEAAVRRRLSHSGPIRPYHASDALGLAVIGLFRFGPCAGGIQHRPAAGSGARSRSRVRRHSPAARIAPGGRKRLRTPP